MFSRIEPKNVRDKIGMKLLSRYQCEMRLLLGESGRYDVTLQPAGNRIPHFDPSF